MVRNVATTITLPVIFFAAHFNLGKTQPELDFVNVPINSDIPLFIDPFAISQRTDRWSQDCHSVIVEFFTRVIHEIRSGHSTAAKELLLYLGEPNETRFGFSKHRPRGAGIGEDQSEQIFQALSESTAVRTGFINSLQECELMIEGIARDKISDLTTNIIRGKLAEYTREQCSLLKIPVSQVPLSPYFEPAQSRWLSSYWDLPVAGGRPILLVPKVIARFDPAYNHQRYYRQFVLEYLQAEHLEAHSSLVQTLKNRRRVVYKKDVAATFPCTKENLFQFSRGHPEVLQEYREHLERLQRIGPVSEVDADDESLIAQALIVALQSIPAGSDRASDYHSLMIGIVEFLFFPNLLYPQKEREIHQGRKRIDIVMQNGARDGIFHRLHAARNFSCAFVVFECKNYQTDIANPELDQIGGRFSPNRGRVGFICCRNFEDRPRFIERCRDTFRDDRGLIVPLDDVTVVECLQLIESGRRAELDGVFNRFIDEVWYS
jgi:hypothetical protein